MAASDQKVIATCALVSVGVGSANAMLKHKKPPSSRFLIGSGMAFFLLSALSQGEPEVAKGLALGVTTTILLGEGGGVLSYLDKGELDTRKSKQSTADIVPPGSPPVMRNKPPRIVVQKPNGATFRMDTLPGFPGLPVLTPHIFVNDYSQGTGNPI